MDIKLNLTGDFMKIPTWDKYMKPILETLSDKKEHNSAELRDSIQKKLQLSDDVITDLLPSGKQTFFANRVGWATTHLRKAGLVESPYRGKIKITTDGIKVLKENPDEINKDILMTYKTYIDFVTPKDNKEKTSHNDPITSKLTPEELLESSYNELRENISQDLIKQIKDCSPEFFERLVVDLLINMGYGGSRKDAGEAIGKSGDEGIDGIIKDDKLGLETIYIQAKRWEGNVSRPEIQKFAGALSGKKAKKGVFITTSDFSKHAWEYVSIIDTKIVLINGETLTDLMIDNNVGVSTINSYELKKMDMDYFEE